MTAPLKAIRAADDVAATMRSIGHEARAAAHVLALAPAAQKNRALGAMAKSVRRRTCRNPRCQRRGHRRGEIARRDGSLHRPPHARPRADRGDGGRARGRAQAQGSGRNRHGIVAAAERHAHRAHARAARCCRRDLREPAERHRRCRRALPQGRQCRDPARRLGKFPLDPRHPCGAARQGLAKPACRRRRSRWCRRATAPLSA